MRKCRVGKKHIKFALGRRIMMHDVEYKIKFTLHPSAERKKSYEVYYVKMYIQEGLIMRFDTQQQKLK